MRQSITSLLGQVWVMVGCLVGGASAQAPAGQAGDVREGAEAIAEAAADEDLTATGEVTTLAELEEVLRREFPDRRSVEERGQALVALLRGFLVRSPDGRDSGRARLLLSEALTLLHERRKALALLEEVAGFGPAESDRARALYLLGEDRFVRERYLRRTGRDGRSLAGAADFWRSLADQFPESPWAAGVARPLRYFELIEQAASVSPSAQESRAPVFEALFDVNGEAHRFSSAQLDGKVIVLDFWRSTTRGQDEFERSFAHELTDWVASEPGLRGKFQILSINLDRRRERFERARAAWEIPWPQLHDGLGFETPLAQLFAIPRLPHRAVISTEGRLVYLGANYQRFADAINGQLEPFTR